MFPYCLITEDINWFKVLQIMLISSFKFFVAIPIAFKMKFNCIQTIIFTTSGGITGVFFYYFVTSGLLKLFNRYLSCYYQMLKTKLTGKIEDFKTKHPPKRKKVERKKFTRKNKIIIKIKKKWGLYGIAALTPILLTVPLGTFLATKYYKRKGAKKILFALCISIISWSILLSALAAFFKITF